MMEKLEAIPVKCMVTCLKHVAGLSYDGFHHFDCSMGCLYHRRRMIHLQSLEMEGCLC